MHESLQGATFHVEHVMPRSRGGDATAANLAWSCPRCNLHKSDRIEVLDPLTGDGVRLFNPRANQWTEHFRWDEYYLVPLSGIGRATERALFLNDARRIRIRRAEALFGLFPPLDEPNG